MLANLPKGPAIFLFLVMWLLAAPTFAATTTASVQKAKQDAEAKGYAFIASHDEILANAKKEGKVRVHSSLDPNTYKPLMETFKKKYPFADIEIQEMTGTDTAQRFLLELKAGTVKDIDGLNLPEDHYPDYTQHVR
jgi:ABC-type glycerol-3-phosphate transport system substrate-binding protein